ncbi:MAG TPA: L,D-transpeptidase family protein, partial [Geobacteraceae bacterium]|nr:L,D-transpeptidase family protein [Geobacteraceae bacterium]
NEGKLVRSLPVTLGKSEADNSVWQTPTGRFRIVEKEKNPAWHVPKSIREQQAKEGSEVKEIVPPGDDNPLGKYALRTSIPGILIHSTNIPASIYGYGSHGCIRVFPEQMEALFKEVKVNTVGEIIYQPVKVAVTDDSRVFLEVHRDVYKKARDLEQDTRQLLTEKGVADRVDWDKVREILKKRSGLPEDIGL